MNETKFKSLSEEEAIKRIVETVTQADAGAAPFVLVLGSGFSHGLVPTARELISEGLPCWMKALAGPESYEDLSGAPDGKRAEIARDFWKTFVERNTDHGLELALDPRTGLPEDYAAAYKAAFNPDFSGAVGAPAQARKFQRALMRLDQTRLNAAHFLLASLLGVQPGRKRASPLFKARAAFSRLILTTNFDPFLQIALQAVNRLYFMSDTPELGVGDEIFDRETDTIHLVYLHGSVHRRTQAASEEDIQTLKEKNARTLAPVLKRHGVIVLGYSGWDDAIVEALAACDRFDHRLYWCGRESYPFSGSAFGPRVPDILCKKAAYYVRIESAGHFMAQLSNRLVEGLPRLLDNPIGQLKEMLESIDLSELDDLMRPTAGSADDLQPFVDRSDGRAFVNAKESTLERLTDAERVFFGRPLVAKSDQPKPVQPGPVGGSESRAEQPDLVAEARRLLSSARVASALGDHAGSHGFCTKALELGRLPPREEAEIMSARAHASYFLGMKEDAIDDLSKVIEMPNAPVEQVARALGNRGVAWGQHGESEKGLADFTQVIERMPDAPVEQVATALFNRGVAWGKQGEAEKELADYTQVIERMPVAPVKLVAKALINRSVAWGQLGEAEKKLADVTQVIERMPDAPVEQVAQALATRGWNHYLRDDFALFLDDTEAALSKQSNLDFATFNLGLALLACGRDAEAQVAYRRAGERFPQSIETHGLVDLREAEKTWLSKARARPLIELLESLKNPHGG